MDTKQQTGQGIYEDDYNIWTYIGEGVYRHYNKTSNTEHYDCGCDEVFKTEEEAKEHAKNCWAFKETVESEEGIKQHFVVWLCNCGDIEQQRVEFKEDELFDYTYEAEKMWDNKAVREAIEGGWITPKRQNQCEGCVDSPCYNGEEVYA